MTAKLARSTYRNDEDIKTMMDAFEKSAKPIFKDAGESAYIKFGSMGCNDPAVGIRRGQLILAGCLSLHASYTPYSLLTFYQERCRIVLQACSLCHRWRCRETIQSHNGCGGTHGMSSRMIPVLMIDH